MLTNVPTFDQCCNNSLSFLDSVKKRNLFTPAAVVSAVLLATVVSATTPTTLTAADVDFVAIAGIIMQWVVVAAMAALTLFGAVQGLKIGIRTFRSIANQATA
jgi:hypothetical protein